MQANAFQLSNIRFAYHNRLALQLNTLNIPACQTSTLIGANGSGKSTLLQLLAFISAPMPGGELSFFGKPVTPSEYLGLRRQVGFLPQKPYMLKGSVLDNIKKALKFHHIQADLWPQKIDSTLEILAIQHLKHRLASSLSGGELQQTALARILVLEPKVLILDEPFSYLDQQSVTRLQQFIESYSKQPHNTLIFSTHNRLQGMALSENIISLVQGKSVTTPLVNLFHGQIRDHQFDTGHINIQLTDNIKQ